MMGPKFDKEPNYDSDDEKPKVVLQTHNSQICQDTRPRVSLRIVDSSSSHGENLNTVSRGRYKFILNVENDPKNASSSK